MKPGAVLTFDKERNIAEIRLKGSQTERSLVDAFNALVLATEHRPDMARVWDLSDADLGSLDTAAIKRLAQHKAARPDAAQKTAVALVIPGARQYSLGRTLQAIFRTATGAYVGVFHTFEGAKVWLSSLLRA